MPGSSVSDQDLYSVIMIFEYSMSAVGEGFYCDQQKYCLRTSTQPWCEDVAAVCMVSSHTKDDGVIQNIKRDKRQSYARMARGLQISYCKYNILRISKKLSGRYGD
jgi:hypothetical protein